MKFLFNGETYDTDKHLFVVGRTYDKVSWYSYHKGDSFYESNATIKCKKGTIISIYMDYNHGQSFVSGFDINVPSYQFRLNSNKVIFAESPQKARKKYDDMVREKKL